MIRAVDEGNFFRIISDDRDLNYDKYFSKGNKLSEEKFMEYNSSNTELLSIKQIISVLKETFPNL